jgi:hypothetical protein
VGEMTLRRSAEVPRLDPEASDHGHQYSTNFSYTQRPPRVRRHGWQRQKGRCQPLSCLAVCERYSDVTRRVAGAKAHQHAALLVGARSFKRVANVTGFRNALSGNL